MQAINPVFVMLLIPVFSFGLYPKMERIFPLRPLRKISLGLFIATGAFLICAQLQTWIDAGQTPSIGWQLLAYLILTAAEVLVSITCLEFSYTQAPPNLKSLVMAAFLMSVSVGNLFTAGVNYAIQRPDGSTALAGASYYLFFAGLMFATAVLFVPVAMRFKERRYIQITMGETSE
jgi:POT family proton-dependent oligopeptide transporter